MWRSGGPTSDVPSNTLSASIDFASSDCSSTSEHLMARCGSPDANPKGKGSPKIPHIPGIFVDDLEKMSLLDLTIVHPEIYIILSYIHSDQYYTMENIEPGSGDSF